MLYKHDSISPGHQKKNAELIYTFLAIGQVQVMCAWSQLTVLHCALVHETKEQRQWRMEKSLSRRFANVSAAPFPPCPFFFFPFFFFICAMTHSQLSPILTAIALSEIRASELTRRMFARAHMFFTMTVTSWKIDNVGLWGSLDSFKSKVCWRTSRSVGKSDVGRGFDVPMTST